MSTFTTIKTAIRDSETMYRILRSIPGAEIERNKILPLKSGGMGVFEFVVKLPGDVGTGFLAGLLGSLKYFCIYRDETGNLTIEVNQEQSAAFEVESKVRTALAAEDNRQRRDIEETECQRLIEEQRRTEELEQRKRVRAGQRAKAESDAQKEAAALIARMETDRKRPQTQTQAPATAEDGKRFSSVLAQEYAKEKILEQVADLEAQQGIALQGVERLEDGTIEITLRG